ncbi:PhnA-like protein [Lichenibacterium ramalinae]|uniref:PhnA-like protein n=1 Tax=Lichenibacterium ramalinae TaxID=2316527 RepID=A0A4Q2RHQ2_9HYPH|nr:PhnA-like protein [Lichenibacterium ramalinae]RYB07222.1 PhnA-like protein [Lichenibacterium ramalinae]
MAISPLSAGIATPLAVPAHERHRISWGAVFAGVVAGLVVQLLLSILGLGIGLATVDPATSGTPSASSLSIGAAVWWIVSGIVASAAGGFLAGRLSGKPGRMTNGYHGLVAWAATTLVVVFLLSSAVGSVFSGAFGAVSGIVGGAGHLVGGTVQTAAQAVAPALPQIKDPLAGIEGQIKSATDVQDPAQLRDTAASAVRAALTGDAAQQQQASDKAAEALAKARGIPLDDAKAQVAQYRQQYQQAAAQAKAKATEIADATARTTSQASLAMVLALVLGAIAAAFGGRAGTMRDLA